MSLQDRLSRARSLPFVLEGLRRAYLRTRLLLEPYGVQLVYGSYDSPIPKLHELPAAYFDQPREMPGVRFEIDEQLAFLESKLAPFVREFDPPVSAAQAGPHRYHLNNNTYDSVDGELLYAVVRHVEPKRIIELGSGFSTLVIREALQRGGRDASVLSTFDPYRSDLLPEQWVVTALPAQDVGLDVFAELDDGDILFVDTSHTVKIGGDVNRIVLEVLPTLASGVIVHFHDIFLPYPYSRSHLLGAHFWSEQYLLQAFLSGNPDWEVLLAGCAVSRAAPERLAAVVPSFAPGVVPGAFWIRRR